MNIIVSPTPNPNAMKFTVEVKLVAAGSRTFDSAKEAEADPLAKCLFAVTGVKSVFILGSFVTVTRVAGVGWSDLLPRLERAMREHFGG